jgi:hypothetical protein
MKATFDLPDRLYREVKARTAQEGRTVREVVVGLFEQWLDKGKSAGASTPRVDWRKQLPPLAHLVREGPANHSMESVRRSIAEHWDEPR